MIEPQSLQNFSSMPFGNSLILVSLEIPLKNLRYRWLSSGSIQEGGTASPSQIVHWLCSELAEFCWGGQIMNPLCVIGLSGNISPGEQVPKTAKEIV
jgi:hypothetical protein